MTEKLTKRVVQTAVAGVVGGGLFGGMNVLRNIPVAIDHNWDFSYLFGEHIDHTYTFAPININFFPGSPGFYSPGGSHEFVHYSPYPLSYDIAGVVMAAGIATLVTVGVFAGAKRLMRYHQSKH